MIVITWLLWFIIFVWFTVALMPDPRRQWRSNWLRLSLAPDFIIGGRDDPYLLRWWIVPRNKWFNVYLHKILRNDNDRALHDHPWNNCSVIISGQYREMTLYPQPLASIVEMQKQWSVKEQITTWHWPQCTYLREVGSMVTRAAEHPHRLELVDGKPCWTLFISGSRRREWGFHTKDGWVHWKDFTDPDDPGVTRK